MISASASRGTGEQRGRQVLVDDGLHAAVATEAVGHHRDPTAPGTRHDEAGVEQHTGCFVVEKRARFRRRDDAAPATHAAVFPRLAVLDHQRRFSAR
jgi:hypothetical protein